MRYFGIWTIFVALTISVVAAYYSIIGLVAIFAASMIPVIIMGSVLEVGKITTAVWLHKYWDKATLLMKSYLTIAVLLLMFITSMGIFGFLSKAHIEQTAMAGEGVAQLERVEADIARNKAAITRADEKMIKLESSDETIDTNIQTKIATEENRIADKAERLQVAIAEQSASIDLAVAPYIAQQQQADDALALMNGFVENNEVKKIQGLIGEVQDGSYGTKTAAAVKVYRINLLDERASALFIVNELREDTRDEISRLRANFEKQVAASNTLINRMTTELSVVERVDTEQDITALQLKIKISEELLDKLYETKYTIETESRKLEAEVGPVKYIAALIYGDDPTQDTLEDAVRWIIMILVVVFDPLAVVLVIAGISILDNKKKEEGIVEIDEQAEYERARAQRIVDNVPHEIDAPEEEIVLEEVIETPQPIESHLPDIDFPTLRELEIVLEEETAEEREIRELNEQRELNDASRQSRKSGNEQALKHVEDISNRLIERGSSIASINDIVGAADDNGVLEQLLEGADTETLEDVQIIIASKINQIKESK
jgi:ABC-type multidrug transport system fused ATPase/permease subunit